MDFWISCFLTITAVTECVDFLVFMNFAQFRIFGFLCFLTITAQARVMDFLFCKVFTWRAFIVLCKFRIFAFFHHDIHVFHVI